MADGLSSGMMLHAALESAEQLLNPLLQRDPAALARLAALDGKVIRVCCSQPALALRIWPSARGLHFERDNPADAEATADAQVHGSLNDFVRFMLAGERRDALLFEGALTLQGDTAVVHKLQQITASLDLDLAAVSEKLIGVVPTALLSAPLAGLARWRRSLMRSTPLDWQEYLQYELALLPAEAEQAAYTSAVLDLRRRTERMEARMQRLQQQISTLAVAGSSDTSSDPS